MNTADHSLISFGRCTSTPGDCVITESISRGHRWVGAAALRRSSVPGTQTAAPTTGVAGAEYFLARAFIVLRTVQLGQASIVMATSVSAYRAPVAVVGLLAGQVLWCLVLGKWVSRDHSYLRPVAAVADFALGASGLVLLGLLCRGAGAETWTNWMFPVGTTVAMGAAVALRALWAVAGTALLTAAHLVGAAPALLRGEASSSNAVGNGLSYGGFLLLVLVLARQLRRTGTDIDAATDRAVRAEEASTRQRERNRQYHRLHDGALATLTLIGTGGLDPSVPAVKERAARDAAALRLMIENEAYEDYDSVTTLASSLAALVSARKAEGMAVSYLANALPTELPSTVVAALTAAVAEALTNVVKHAQGSPAWVTATGDDGRVTLTITDQGPGTSSTGRLNGRGLERSIRLPVEAVGGAMTFTSVVDSGTSLSLQWPA